MSKSKNNKPISKMGSLKDKVIQMTPKVLNSLTESQVSAAANEVVEKPKKTSFLKSLGSAAGKLLGEVAPIAASFIPGVGPIASKVLSTLNDDEWFGEYNAAGATFNELLAMQARKNSAAYPAQLYDIQGAVAALKCNILLSSDWKDQCLPTILAYVREKTSNVLNATEQEYWDAFVAGSKLYAIYYNLLKYRELMQHLPLNIPNLPKLITVASPVNYSMLCGVIDSLKGYLEATIKLPYAWTEYLRWRFGTCFKSSNTGKPGLIMYEFVSWAADPATIDTNVIDPLKAVLVASGRATADIKLAYNDHQIRFDVEEAHYDEKEFCLRCNFWSNLTGRFGDGSEAAIYLDSRLDPSAALQAVVMSTNGTNALYAPIGIEEARFCWYNMKDITIPWTDAVATVGKNYILTAGWHLAPLLDYLHAYEFSVGQGANPNVYTCRLNSDNVRVAADLGTPDLAAEAGILKTIGAYVADSLEFHNLAAGFAIYSWAAGAVDSFYRGKALAFDTAYVTDTQLDSIHRMAMRNLIRGNYKVKVAPAVKPAIKDAVSDVVSVVSDSIQENL